LQLLIIGSGLRWPLRRRVPKGDPPYCPPFGDCYECGDLREDRDRGSAQLTEFMSPAKIDPSQHEEALQQLLDRLLTVKRGYLGQRRIARHAR
jgi:hypothetical protein